MVNTLSPARIKMRLLQTPDSLTSRLQLGLRKAREDITKGSRILIGLGLVVVISAGCGPEATPEKTSASSEDFDASGTQGPPATGELSTGGSSGPTESASSTGTLDTTGTGGDQEALCSDYCSKCNMGSEICLGDCLSKPCLEIQDSAFLKCLIKSFDDNVNPVCQPDLCLDQGEDYIACVDKELLKDCGNGQVEGVEQCDDGNLIDDDACSNTCQINKNIDNSVTVEESDLYFDEKIRQMLRDRDEEEVRQAASK